jgi:flagella basal body P-ring formation protein FlgA
MFGPFVCVAAVIAFTSGAIAAEAMLKQSITVAMHYVTLSDILDVHEMGSENEVEEVRVALAPLPGRKIFLSPHKVQKIAAAHGFMWRNLERVEHIVVRRESQVIETDAIKSRLELALIEDGALGPLQIQIGNRDLKLHAPVDAGPDLSVSISEYDPRTGHFRAKVNVAELEDTTAPLKVTGRAFQVASIPVLANTVAPGDTISESDLDWIELRAERISQNLIADAASLIGFTPRRAIRVGHPIRRNDVQAPVLTPKGSSVIINFQAPGIVLTARGRALEDGAAGQVIRIMNPKSNRTIEAKIVGVGEATVSSRQVLAKLN